MQVVHRATRLVKQTIAFAKRRPLVFFGIWAAKWVIFYVVVQLLASFATTDSTLRVAGAQVDNHHILPVKQERGLDTTDALMLATFATIQTDLGDIVLELLPEVAPKTVANFIELAHRGFFNDTTLYRYEANFVLQGGGWPKKSSPLPPVPLEYQMPNYKYHVSTARTADPNSATCEYSIMLNDNSKWLGPGGSDPHGYAVFARVHDGVDVIERFASLKTRKSGLTMLDPAVKVRAWVISTGTIAKAH